MILLSDGDEELKEAFLDGWLEDAKKIARAQHAADVAWLEGKCEHHIMSRRYCPTCWLKFVAVKE